MKENTPGHGGAGLDSTLRTAPQWSRSPLKKTGDDNRFREQLNRGSVATSRPAVVGTMRDTHKDHSPRRW